VRFQDFVAGNVEYHDGLNPKIWDDGVLDAEVHFKLLEAAKSFIRYLEIPNFQVLDIVLTGSMASYNYTKFSDFDLHVVTRYSDLQCDDLAEAFYRAKKSMWNDAHDITIYGYDVELYVEDVNVPPVSSGTFSVLKNKWLAQPRHQKPSIDDRAINLKVKDLSKQIEVAMAQADDPEDIKRITDKLRKMRRAGLDSTGEFGVENLTFKILRNLGYLDALNKAYHREQDKNLSLYNN
jgi:predicted nucleotidyltransferase